ncbi:hypothetical protein [Roseofilum casamattae]|uniref:Helix-turn-helix domain-containing protein n=1 Tax=Roseofilum casamattae BLCC-M143 TaxID=3022442 RepID=A0ABT7C1D0_9CYAN|nr:hypothetical protein [Roseofilum casamattae]MDJ1185264.1 hypothetical protein [Roseofilum casamattae BLCC-M143]
MYDLIYVERLERKTIEGTAYSISAAARALGMDRRSLYPYMRLANLYFPDYRTAKKAGDKYSPKTPLLNGYMVWCLAKIKQIFAIQNTRKAAILAIRDQKNLFTLEKYEHEQYSAQNRLGA